jgi:hypothetical protein
MATDDLSKPPADQFNVEFRFAMQPAPTAAEGSSLTSWSTLHGLHSSLTWSVVELGVYTHRASVPRTEAGLGGHQSCNLKFALFHTSLHVYRLVQASRFPQ